MFEMSKKGERKMKQTEGKITCVVETEDDACVYRGKENLCRCKNKNYTTRDRCSWIKKEERANVIDRRKGD